MINYLEELSKIVDTAHRSPERGKRAKLRLLVSPRQPSQWASFASG
jgi:hypothetical protein